MNELEQSGAESDIDYVVYEVLGCGVVQSSISCNNAETLIVCKNRIRALIKECNRFVEKIDENLDLSAGGKSELRPDH